MPRSGTSLVTQMLHRCGLNLGPTEQLMPASSNNPDGFWENLRFVRVNERLLAASNGTWFAPPSTLRPTPEIMAEAQSILLQFQGGEPWGWKDPRNALTLPFWKHLLPSMKVLACVRHPAETAYSLAASTLVPRVSQLYWSVTRADSPVRLASGQPSRLERFLRSARVLALSSQKRRDLIHEIALELWRVYNTRVLSETSATDRLVTHYDAVLSRPHASLERILDFAGISVSSNTMEKAVQAVLPGLRHQRANGMRLREELAALYERLKREAHYEA